MKKLTVILEDDLYTATKVEAARHNRKLREVVAEALNEWLELVEDGRLLNEAMAEYEETGGVELDEAFRQLEVERKSA
jgi:plasmid stability protein